MLEVRRKKVEKTQFLNDLCSYADLLNIAFCAHRENAHLGIKREIKVFYIF
jgi:hypothetical protein